MDKHGNLYYIPGSGSVVRLEFKQDGTLAQTVMADVAANEYPHIDEYAVDCDGNLAYYNEDEKKIIFIAANGEKVGEHPCEPNGCKLYCDVQGKIVFVCFDEDKTYSVVSFVPFEKTERCDGNYWQSFSSKNRGKIIVGEGSKLYLISSDGSKEELGAEFAIPSPLAETVRLARHDSVLYYDGTWLDSNNNWHLGLIKFDMDDLSYKCIKEGYEDDSDWSSEIGGFHVYDVRCDNDGVLYFQGERISDGAYVTGAVSEDGNMNVLFENDTGVRELYYPAQI